MKKQNRRQNIEGQDPRKTWSAGIYVNKMVLKTILYRICASSFAQVASWIVCGQIMINAIVLIIDGSQMILYYAFEKLWTKRYDPS